MKKYDWDLRTFQSINWKSNEKSIRDNRYTQKPFIKRFIHHRLPVGKMIFSAEHRCPYCDKAQDRNTEHDHFLQCNSLREEKTRWIDKLRAILFKNFNPPNLHEEILERIYNYYEVILWDSKKSETSNWIISMTLLAIQKRRYRQKDIREELLNQIAIRIPMMNHPYPHPQTTKTKTH